MTAIITQESALAIIAAAWLFFIWQTPTLFGVIERLLF